MSLSEHVRVDLGTVEASTSGTGTATADGCVWTVTNIEGWDAPDQRSTKADPTGVHGSYLSGVLSAGRLLQVSGWVEATSREDAWTAYYRCTGALPGLIGSMDLKVYETPTKVLRVRQAEPPQVSAPVNACFSFTLVLLAEYPFKRAETPVTVSIPAGDTVTVTHSGTFAAEFTATTTSSGTVRLASAGLQLECASVPSGTVFDSQEFTVTDSGGTDLYGLIEPGSEWPAVSVGAVDWINSGTADVELSYFPTYA